MKQADWSELLDVLSELHEVAPSYRFGQLICNVTAFVDEPGTVSVRDVEDRDLLAAAWHFLETHRAVDDGAAPRDVWESVVARLRELRDEYPDVSFGQMIGHLATAVRGPEPGAIWDVEDEELMAAADRWLAYRRRRHEAERELERWTREYEAAARHRSQGRVCLSIVGEGSVPGESRQGRRETSPAVHCGGRGAVSTSPGWDG